MRGAGRARGRDRSGREGGRGSGQGGVDTGRPGSCCFLGARDAGEATGTVSLDSCPALVDSVSLSVFFSDDKFSLVTPPLQAPHPHWLSGAPRLALLGLKHGPPDTCTAPPSHCRGKRRKSQQVGNGGPTPRTRASRVARQKRPRKGKRQRGVGEPRGQDDVPKALGADHLRQTANVKH